MLKIISSALMLCVSYLLSAQTGIISGKVFDVKNNEPIPFANVVIQGTTIGAPTDLDGQYRIENLTPDLYNLEVTYLGYQKKIVFEVQVSNSKPAQVDFALEQTAIESEEIVIKAKAFQKPQESPNSLRTIGVNEIQRNPGGNRDISRTLQSLPGVATTASFRNDILIRGGAPNENRFYLDGIEVPNINHFATQGSSGGPVGLINVDFVREVDFYSGAFPANRGNTLSSVLDMKFREGRKDRFGLTFTVGSSDVGLSLEGPMGEKSTFIASARRSYLQFIFSLIELPILPIYNDFQYKQKIKFDLKNELTIIGLGAIDNFSLNQDFNETPLQQYFLDNIPINEQWNYTIGLLYKNYIDNGYTTVALSRNMLNNTSVKYSKNIETPENLLLDYSSQESENKIRIEQTLRNQGWKINYGISYELARYTNQTFNKINVNGAVQELRVNSKVRLQKYGLFLQASNSFLEERLKLSIGTRVDFSDYSEHMANPGNQFSPRFSVSYDISPALDLNFNTGIYYQLPAYTVLGFSDVEGSLINKQNNLKYIRCSHLVGGLGYTTDFNARIAVEGFYKAYSNYPFLLRDSIALANLGADFGIIGNAPVSSTAGGLAYGLEVLYQQKLTKGFYGIAAYTLVRSQFEDRNGELAASSWDNKHLVSLTGGKKFKRNWELGVKWRFSGGAPYTPYDVETSSLIDIWTVSPGGVFDYNLLNTQRLPAIHQLDFRLDKKFFFKKYSLNLYIDVENLYALSVEGPAYLIQAKSEAGLPIINPNDPLRYQLNTLDNMIGQPPIPTIGIVLSY